jgi:hypothetical protein
VQKMNVFWRDFHRWVERPDRHHATFFLYKAIARSPPLWRLMICFLFGAYDLKCRVYLT